MGSSQKFRVDDLLGQSLWTIANLDDLADIGLYV